MAGHRLASRGVLVLVVAAITAAATAVAWLTAAESGHRGLEAALDQQLAVLARAVDSEIERFRYLPAVVGRDRRIVAALTTHAPGDVAIANRYLTDIRAVSQADELYVMAADGLTIASSNHAEPGSFVGQSYHFRPYFRDALAHGEGRYYAVGVTTGIPGYFLSSAIRDGGRIIGVAAVKVDMAGIEAAWRDAPTLTALADGDGVIFLSGHAPWKYRPLHALAPEALAEIARTRKYDGIDLAAAEPLFAGAPPLPARAAVDGSGGAYLIRSIGIEPDGWRLIRAASLAPVYAGAHLVGLLTILVGVIVCGAGIYAAQRRQLVRAKLDEHERLERRVAERTAALNREVEERRRAEAELRDTQETLIQTAKLAALGRMSAAIVHEVSQPLSALENTLATAGVLAERGEAGAVPSKVRTARDLARRIQRTVRHLRTFSRKEQGTAETVSVARSIAASVEIVRHRAKTQGVAIACEVAPNLAVSASPTRLEQVILNLLANALDAVAATAQPHVHVTATRREGVVEIAVGDNGQGVPEHLRDRVAEPFFTTKQTGEGLGLGLSISRAIIQEYGGALTFSSRPGEGSTFVITLPDATDARVAAE